MLNMSVFVGLFWGFWLLLTILNEFFVAMTISSRYYCKWSFVIVFMITSAFLGSVRTVIWFSVYSCWYWASFYSALMPSPYYF